RQGAARDGGQPRRCAPCRHPAEEDGDARLHRRVAARRHGRRADLAGDDDVLRLGLHPRPEGVHRRDHRRPRQLSADRDRRRRRGPLRELRLVLERRAEGRARLRPAHPRPPAAFVARRARRGRRRGDRRMSDRGGHVEGPAADRAPAVRAAASGVDGRALRGLGVAFAVVLLLLAPHVLGTFAVSLLNDIGIGALVAIGLVLLTGIGGATSFGQAAFVGVAAYATAWLTTAHGASPWLGLVFALVLTGLAALVIGALTLRLGGHYLPLSTIAWGLSIPLLFGNIEAL